MQSINAIKGLRLITATLTTDHAENAYVNPDVVGNFYLVLAAASNTMGTSVRVFNNDYGMQYLFVTHADLETPFVGTFGFWILVV